MINVTKILYPEHTKFAAYMVNCWQVKVCDFGLARMVGPNSAYVTTFAGNLIYMAPELFEAQPSYDAFKVDIFSAGLIILGMLTFVCGQTMEHFFHPGTHTGSFI